MASSGLWKNAIFTKTNLPQMAPIYVWQTLVPNGGKLAHQGRGPCLQIWGMCVCYPGCAMGEFGSLWDGGKGITWSGGLRCPGGPHHRCGAAGTSPVLLRDGSLTQINMTSLTVKYSIYNTLAHRARVVSTSQPGSKQEEEHIRQACLR